jgi:hypothetical protein
MFKSKQNPRRSALRAGLVAGTTLLAGAVLSVGCLDRPVTQQTPNTSNVFVDRVVNTKIDKIDLLFVIDNSVSMADKQQILRAAVPTLVRRLVNPSCVNRQTGELVPISGTACGEGFKREFEPVENIHIGVVTSSLGGHGGPANLCAPGVGMTVHPNDRGELLPNVRAGLPTHDPAGFLRWRGADEDNEESFIADFTEHVVGAGETGCGYEAVMESWYRFLIDPEPPVDMTLDGDAAVPTATNTALLAQRAAFLRPDSLVAIIMLSDENDCSIRDGGSDWIAARTGVRLWAASETCDTDPNSACCHSCRVPVPGGCPASARCGGDPAAAPTLPVEEDGPNIRCHDQKRRFGLDFLYPAQRYIDGLTRPTVQNRAGDMVPNPLFAPGDTGLVRDRSLVFLAGIIGVPWQDIATDESITDGAKLEFLTARELSEKGRWAVILGDPSTNTKPTDPLMIESVAPRQGTNPITNDALVTWETPRGNPINGHEFNNIGNDDLQYVCTFPLSTPVPATECATKPTGACDCVTETDAQMQKPLCFNSGAFTTTQHFAKAYPGTRYLEVLRGFGDNSIVASICPKNLVGSDATDPNVGYNPAVGAIVKRLGEALQGTCLPRTLDIDDEGNVPCSVVEVVLASQATPGGCGIPGRAEVAPEVATTIRKQLLESESCADNTCAEWQICSILPVPEGERNRCLTEEGVENSAMTPGYCYIDPSTGLPNAGAQGDGCGPETPENCTNPLVETCDPTRRRLLRLIGKPEAPTPALNSTTFIACVGSALAQ